MEEARILPDEGKLLLDPDRISSEELKEVIDLIEQGVFMPSVCYVEGFDKPQLDVLQEDNTIASFTGAEAIRGYLESQSRL